jgi:hypothetical protein
LWGIIIKTETQEKIKAIYKDHKNTIEYLKKFGSPAEKIKMQLILEIAEE